MHHLLEVWFGWVLHGGYWGIIFLMAMESSIIPIPSEIIIPPAAFLAARGDLNLAGVILAGTLGSYLGAAVGYWICLIIGRPILLQLWKVFPPAAGETGARRKLVAALRDGWRFLCPGLTGHPSPHFLPGWARSDEFLEIQPGNDPRRRTLVLCSGLSGHQGVSGATGLDL